MNKLRLSLIALVAISCSQKEKPTVQTAELPISGFNIDNIDSQSLACDNFFQYACGGWIEKHPIPKTEGRWGIFNELNENNNLKLKTILTDLSTKEYPKGSIEQLLTDYYQSAMDTMAIDAADFEPIKPHLALIEDIKSADQLPEIFALFEKSGFASPIGIYVSADAKNSSMNLLDVSQGGLGLPDRDYYLAEDEKIKTIQGQYKTYLKDLMMLIGKSEAEASSTAETVFNFETKLAQISMSRRERRDPDKTYNKFLTSELATKYPAIAFDKIFQNLELNPQNVNVGQTDYMSGLNDLIKKENIATWKAYLLVRILNSSASDLSSRFENLNFDFYQTTLSGVKAMKPRWKRVINKINGYLSDPMGQKFVEKYFPEESKAQVSQMVENLRASFRQRIAQLTWMSDSTKIQAYKKLDAFTYKIGYPNKWKDYSKVDIAKDQYFANNVNLKIRFFDEMKSKVDQPVDKSEWQMPPQIVNAYYSPENNEIVFPAGILQPPFFDPKADNAVNYGGIGAVIGHEFSHGFDDQGSKYDGQGNLNQWWSEEDLAKFTERADKLAALFDTYEALPGEFVDGKLTLGENIADLAGLTLAYYAYQNSLNKSEAPIIDGFTGNQRFFLGWAQVWTMDITKETLSQRLKTDPHSPAKYRVLSPLSNLKEFDEAFGCSPNNEKIVIW